MKMVLARLFPRVFGGIGIKKMEVPDQHPGSEHVELPGDEQVMEDVELLDDEKIMVHLGEKNGFPVARCKLDGGLAHPVWLRAVAGERRRQTGSWF